MASNSQFRYVRKVTSLKNVSEILICPWTRLWWMGATWLYEHKQNHKKSSLKLLVRFWNNLIEMFLEWPFSELFLKFWSVNKHGITVWRLLALYRHKEIHVNSSLKATKKNWLQQSQKIRWAIQSHLGPLVMSRDHISFSDNRFSYLRGPSLVASIRLPLSTMVLWGRQSWFKIQVLELYTKQQNFRLVQFESICRR